MRERVLSALSAGEAIDLDEPELNAALRDSEFRRSLVTDIIGHFELSDVLDPGGEEVDEMVKTPETIGEFLASLGPFLAMRESMSAGLEPSKVPLDSAVDTRPPPVKLGSDALGRALEQLSRSFYISPSFGEQVSIEGDVFVLPNFEMARFEIEWTGAFDKEGSIALAEETRGNPSRPDREGRVQQWIKTSRSASEGGLISADGRCTVRVPQDFENCTFQSGEVDRAEQIGAQKITLMSCENDCASVEIEGADQDVPRLVIARDSHGRRLVERESQTSGTSKWKTDIRFGGTIATVDVFLATTTSTHELSIKATSTPDGDGEVSAPRYLLESPDPKFQVVTSAQIADEVEVVSGRLASSFDFNQPSIHAHLPRVSNSTFASVEFDEPFVADEDGSVVDCSVIQRGCDEESHCFRYSLEGKDSDPVEFSSVEGALTILYPLEFTTVQLTPNEPVKNGLRASFDGCRVTMSFEDDRDDGFDVEWISQHMQDSTPSIQALDEEGRVLKPLNNKAHGSDGFRASFWGIPKSIRVHVVTESDSVQLRYHLTPSPLIDEEHRGTDGPHNQCRQPIMAQEVSKPEKPISAELPHPNEVAIEEAELQNNYLKIEVDRSSDPAWHFSFAVHRESKYGPQGETPPNEETPFTTLGLFHREDPVADIEVLGQWLTREIHPADWLDIWLGQMGVTPLSVRPIQTPAGVFGDVVATWETPEGPFAGRFATLRYGRRLFVIVLRTPLKDYAKMADAYFLALSSFEPLHTDNDPPFAEDLQPISNSAPVTWEASLPMSWSVESQNASTELGSLEASLDAVEEIPTPHFGQFTLTLFPRSATKDESSIVDQFYNAVSGDGLMLAPTPLQEIPPPSQFEQAWSSQSETTMSASNGEPIPCSVQCRLLRNDKAWVLMGVFGPQQSTSPLAWAQCARVLDFVGASMRIGD